MRYEKVNILFGSVLLFSMLFECVREVVHVSRQGVLARGTGTQRCRSEQGG